MGEYVVDKRRIFDAGNDVHERTNAVSAGDCMDAGGTSPWKDEVERRTKPKPRATHGAVTEGCYRLERGKRCEIAPKCKISPGLGGLITASTPPKRRLTAV